MIRIWNTYKVWVIIGLAYAGFYFFTSFKILKQIVSSLHTKFFLHNHYQQKKVKEI